MPCNGVAVATSRIENDLTQYITDNLEAVKTALSVYLEKKFGGQVSYARVYGNTLAIEFQNHTIRIARGQAFITRSRYADATKAISPELSEGVTDLLSGLAQLLRQKDAIQKIKNTGARFSRQQTAPNGAVVLEVEI